jgi:hypothetical protein
MAAPGLTVAHINPTERRPNPLANGIPEECWFVKQGFWVLGVGPWARRSRTRPPVGSWVVFVGLLFVAVVRSTVSRLLVMCERHALWGAQPSLRPAPKLGRGGGMELSGQGQLLGSIT